MCHEFGLTRAQLEAWLAEEAREQDDDSSTGEAVAETPSFLNEERERDVEILTDGGT